MSVYIDDMEVKFGRMIMCHMIADTHDELLKMARAIGMRDTWIQHEGTYREHFDVSKNRKLRAIEAGAIEITQRDLATRLIERRDIDVFAEYWYGRR